MIGIAAVNTVSEDNAIWNNFESGLLDIVNILKEKRAILFFTIVFSYIPLKDMLFLCSQLFVTKKL